MMTMSPLMRRIGMWVLIAILVLAGLFMLVVGEVKSLIPHPKGTIFITSSADATQSFLQTYALNVVDGSTATVGAASGSIGTMYAFSSDGSKSAFIGVTQDRINQAAAHKMPIGQMMQVYRSPNPGNAQAVPSIDASEQLTTTPDMGKVAPAIADDGSVLYVTSPAQSDQSLNGYTLHLVSAAGADRTILQGAIQPHWLSNDAFYYIGVDGVRLGSVSAASSNLVLPITGQLNFKISVSPDHRILAFSNPDMHKVFFFTISHGGAILSPLKELDMLGYWVVFSPDSRFFAVQTAQDNGTNASTHPSLAFFDVASFTHIGETALDPLLNDRLFITAWK